MFTMQDPIAFSPKPDELRFFSTAEAVRYARNANFMVIVDNGVITAIRADMPDTKFVLKRDTEKPEKFVWIRS